MSRSRMGPLRCRSCSSFHHHPTPMKDFNELHQPQRHKPTTDLRTKAAMMWAMNEAGIMGDEARDAATAIAIMQNSYRRHHSLAEMRKVFGDKYLKHALVVFNRSDLLGKNLTEEDGA